LRWRDLAAAFTNLWVLFVERIDCNDVTIKTRRRTQWFSHSGEVRPAVRWILLTQCAEVREAVSPRPEEGEQCQYRYSDEQPLHDRESYARPPRHSFARQG
jgi:hypothetical protein